jgi:hypothetical protein
MTNKHDTTTDAESYAHAVDRLHALGCTLARESTRRYAHAGRVVVFGPDESAYRCEVDELATLAEADDLQPWQVPTACASCELSLDLLDGDRGATQAYPHCETCHYNGRAGDYRHAGVIAACEARGLRAFVEQTGGGCMNLRILRAGAEPVPGEVDSYGEPWTPSVVAVGAEHDESGAWVTLDATLPDQGGNWCAWLMSSPSHDDGTTWPDADSFVTGAEALAAWADSNLPPVAL